jgi:hypothetical protein
MKLLVISLTSYAIGFILGWWTSKLKYQADENRRRWEEIIEKMRRDI